MKLLVIQTRFYHLSFDLPIFYWCYSLDVVKCKNPHRVIIGLYDWLICWRCYLRWFVWCGFELNDDLLWLISDLLLYGDVTAVPRCTLGVRVYPMFSWVQKRWIINFVCLLKILKPKYLSCGDVVTSLFDCLSLIKRGS